MGFFEGRPTALARLASLGWMSIFFQRGQKTGFLMRATALCIEDIDWQK